MSDGKTKTDNVVPLPQKAMARPCPTCRKPMTPDFKPFCSKRCADIDLGRWLKEDYRVPVAEQPDQYEEE